MPKLAMAIYCRNANNHRRRLHASQQVLPFGLNTFFDLPACLTPAPHAPLDRGAGCEVGHDKAFALYFGILTFVMQGPGPQKKWPNG